MVTTVPPLYDKTQRLIVAAQEYRCGLANAMPAAARVVVRTGGADDGGSITRLMPLVCCDASIAGRGGLERLAAVAARLPCGGRKIILQPWLRFACLQPGPYHFRKQQTFVDQNLTRVFFLGCTERCQFLEFHFFFLTPACNASNFSSATILNAFKICPNSFF